MDIFLAGLISDDALAYELTFRKKHIMTKDKKQLMMDLVSADVVSAIMKRNYTVKTTAMFTRFIKNSAI